MFDRYLVSPILADLNDRKMVFIGGPRQVGKTTMAREFIAHHFTDSTYLNWDNRNDRRKIINAAWPGDESLVIFDELHKYKKWKNFIKGEYDVNKERLRFLVTGSARLDLYRKGGDSLQGRYHYFRLHPLSMAELERRHGAQTPFEPLALAGGAKSSSFDSLLHFGGFPEPLTKSNERFSRRWHNEKVDRMIREDINEVSILQDIGSVQLLSDLLPSKVGSLLSTNALREDLEVSFRAVARWLDLLESFYYHFRIYPFTSSKIRSLKKEPKLYLWDWSELPDNGARFENMVASHLLKFTHFLHDVEGFRSGLFFLRDLAKNEVDFLVTVDNRPWFAVEAKSGETEVAPNLINFRNKLDVPYCYQLVEKPGIHLVKSGISIISADRFLASLV